jgi:hypothetical protein
MITTEVKISGTTIAELNQLNQQLGNRTQLHAAIGETIEDQTVSWLKKRNTKSPNTNYYGNAAKSVTSFSDAQGATVRMLHRGLSLRYTGGVVLPGKSISSKTGKPTKSIALASKFVPIRNGNRLLPHDFPSLAFIPSRKGGDTTGVLVLAEKKLATRGKNKGRFIDVAIPQGRGGKIMFVLRKRTTHTADPTVIPSDKDLSIAAEKFIRRYIDTLINIQD